MKTATLLFIVLLFGGCSNNSTPPDELFLGDSEKKAIRITKNTASTTSNHTYETYKEKDNSISHEVNYKGVPVLAAICVGGIVTHLTCIVPSLTGENIDQPKIDHFKSEIRSGKMPNIEHLRENYYSYSEIEPTSYITIFSMKKDNFLATFIINARSTNDLAQVRFDAMKKFTPEYEIDFY